LRDFLKVKSVKTSNELIDYLLTNEENEISKNKISEIWYGIGLER